MKLFFRTCILAATLGISLQAQDIPGDQAAHYNSLADINPDDLVGFEAQKTSESNNLQLAWEYLKLQAELAKIHIGEHKKAYAFGTTATLGTLILIYLATTKK